MQIRGKLPSEYELKWKRLLATFGPNADELAIMAVDVLWTKCRKDVEASERVKHNLSRKISTAKKRLTQKGTKKTLGSGVFVGNFTSKVSRRGGVVIPRGWFQGVQDRKVLVIPDEEESCLRIVPCQCDTGGEKLSERAYKTTISRNGLLWLNGEARSVAHIEIGSKVTLSGALRMIKVKPVRS